MPQLSSAPICAVCWTESLPQPSDACTRCGDTLDARAAALPFASALCRACRMAPPPFVRAVSYGLYQGRMKAAIHALKYGRIHPASRQLGRMLAEAIAQLAGEASTAMLVIPVPLHRRKQSERGFNQARALAESALARLRRTHPAWQLTLAPKTLMRLRPTASQAGLTARDRRINLRRAFTVSDPQAVLGRHVLLVDDILTTGATARAAALALTEAGAASVWVATLARARRGNQAGNFSYEDQAGTPGDPHAQALTAGSDWEPNSSHHQPSF